jgi:hypothetical protein
MKNILVCSSFASSVAFVACLLSAGWVDEHNSSSVINLRPKFQPWQRRKLLEYVTSKRERERDRERGGRHTLPHIIHVLPLSRWPLLLSLLTGSTGGSLVMLSGSYRHHAYCQQKKSLAAKICPFSCSRERRIDEEYACLTCIFLLALVAGHIICSSFASSVAFVACLLSAGWVDEHNSLSVINIRPKFQPWQRRKLLEYVTSKTERERDRERERERERGGASHTSPYHPCSPAVASAFAIVTAHWLDGRESCYAWWLLLPSRLLPTEEKSSCQNLSFQLQHRKKNR